MSQTILVTGGCGFIGSHTVVELLEHGHKVVIYDNLSNSSIVVVDRIRCIVEPKLKKHIPLTFIQGDLREKEKLTHVFANYNIDSVIHFAALKSVDESITKPLHYYDNNILGTICLCKVMNAANVKTLVFSSSATVYGENATSPCHEDMPSGRTTNPYGSTKAIIERILNDLCLSDCDWSIAILRYFNPIGAHKSGLIGEDPKGVPNNLLPYISQVAIGKLNELSVFGGDYDTIDGTGVRDYIHVVDLAKGHLSALDKIKSDQDSESMGMHIWNLGTGKGFSVLEVIKAFENASNIKICYSIKSRRPGDVASSWANPEKSYKELGWKTSLTLKEMVEDSWNWQIKNPNGYE